MVGGKEEKEEGSNWRDLLVILYRAVPLAIKNNGAARIYYLGLEFVYQLHISFGQQKDLVQSYCFLVDHTFMFTGHSSTYDASWDPTAGT